MNQIQIRDAFGRTRTVLVVGLASPTKKDPPPKTWEEVIAELGLG
jgi:hypothetical protein